MEENKPPNNEQQLNTASTTEPIASSETITELEQPSTLENMEVHHHSHASHGKKNWKTYFWEFLMLFLAVFCGFLAEYQLEHKIERERARKNMRDMVENLKYDTIRYNRNLTANELLGKQLDTFRIEISNSVKGDIDGNRLYDLWLKCSDFSSVVFNRSAITQLKSSGSFRLIKNDSLAASIIDYYERKISACEEQAEKLRRMSERLTLSSARFFYYEPFDARLSTETQYGKPVPDSINERNNKPLNSNPSLGLLNTNPVELKLLYNDVAMKEETMKGYNAYLRWAYETAQALMQEIEKEYQFNK